MRDSFFNSLSFSILYPNSFPTSIWGTNTLTLGREIEEILSSQPASSLLWDLVISFKVKEILSDKLIELKERYKDPKTIHLWMLYLDASCVIILWHESNKIVGKYMMKNDWKLRKKMKWRNKKGSKTKRSFSLVVEHNLIIWKANGNVFNIY